MRILPLIVVIRDVYHTTPKQFFQRVIKRSFRRAVNRGVDAAVTTVGNYFSGAKRGYARPPTINFSKTLPYVTRYTMGSAGLANIAVNDLLDGFFVANSATSGLRIFSAVKIRKIEIWAPSGTGGFNAASTVSFTWYNETSGQDVGAPSQVLTDSSVSNNDVPHICVVPPKNSSASMWLSASSNTDPVCAMILPFGTVVDIHLVGVIAEGAVGGGTPQQAVTRAVAGATAGILYSSYMPPAIGSTGLTPVVGSVL